MLHKTVVLVNLQVFCPSRNEELNKIAGQLRNLFYAASLPWSEGNLGRVIPIQNFEDFYGEYQKLQNTFEDLIPSGTDECSVTLTVLPFPKADAFPDGFSLILQAPYIISSELEKRFERRVRMLQEALEKEKRFYASLLSELRKIIDIGIYLEDGRKYARKNAPPGSITPQLFARLKAAESGILIHSADDIRHSASLREDIINHCGALL
jgi:hypothetical protein